MSHRRYDAVDAVGTVVGVKEDLGEEDAVIGGARRAHWQEMSKKASVGRRGTADGERARHKRPSAARAFCAAFTVQPFLDCG